MQSELIRKYSAPVPRYTSFPTAPHFHEGVKEETYCEWLTSLDPSKPISLYAHIPYCDTLCWFCGCHTKMTKSYAPIQKYLEPLMKEIRTVAYFVPEGCRVSNIHWGGGSPTMLKPEHIHLIAGLLKHKFAVDEETEFAVEIDPRGLTQETMKALSKAGVNRASIGVQDFDPEVQKAINRIQTYEETAHVIAGLRDLGIRSINIDALYGLPFQSEGTIERTIEQILTLSPDRIALFGYAHVPWMKRHQSMIDETALPSTLQRFAQAEFAAKLLIGAGYVRIGFDHFAKPHDELAIAAEEKRLRRNFQGYTTDPSNALIGFGASAIGSLPQGYVQNTAPIGEYERRVNETGLATEKGIALCPEDRMRAYVIEQLMCDLRFSKSLLSHKFGQDAGDVLKEADQLIATHEDRLIEQTEDGFAVTEEGRPFLRSICAYFDPYLQQRQARHSVAV